MLVHLTKDREPISTSSKKGLVLNLAVCHYCRYMLYMHLIIILKIFPYFQLPQNLSAKYALT